MPNSPISEGLMNAVKLAETSQKMRLNEMEYGLAVEERDKKKQDAEFQAKKAKFEGVTKLLDIKNQNPEYYQSIVDQMTGIWGMPKLTFRDNYKEGISAIKGVIEAMKNNPGMDSGPALQNIYSQYGDPEHFKTLSAEADKGVAGVAENFVAQTLTGVSPEQQSGVLQELAQQGSYPELRTAAQKSAEAAKRLEPGTMIKSIMQKGQKVDAVIDNATGKIINVIGPTPTTGEPGSAASHWENTINTRYQQVGKKYSMTGDELTAVTDSKDPLTVIASIMAKKQISPEAQKAALGEFKQLEDLRSKGYALITNGKDPYSLLQPSKATAELDKVSDTVMKTRIDKARQAGYTDDQILERMNARRK